MEYVVEMLNIRKEYPGVIANDNITLQLKKGEVHALLGENGAGKSTLMSILFGLNQPDSGSIKLNGKTIKISNPNVANKLGIGMVHQHFQLVQTFTVAENIILGAEPTKGIFTNINVAIKKIKDLSEKYGFNIDPNSKIEDISVGMQQRVEIIKMLYRDADVLIFDEPTAVLTPQEIKELMNIMRNLIAEGKSIVLITHKLKEIVEIADRCTIIRRGKYIDTVDVKQTTTQKMAEMMVGREVSFKVLKQQANVGHTILSIENLNVMSNKKVLGLKNFSLNVNAGEIVGISGVEGNGQTELIEAITGLRKVESGFIKLNNIDITDFSVRKKTETSLAHIPEDRHKHGLVLEFTVEDNMILQSYYKEPFSKNGILDRTEINKYAENVIKTFDVRSGQGSKSLAGALSGGNQQKAIVGREIMHNPDLLIAVQPTRGLDVGAIEYIHKRLIEHRDNDKAVLLVSLELDEVMNLSDRIAVVNHGELIGIVDADNTNENEIGLMMAGISSNENTNTNAVVRGDDNEI